MRDTDGEAHKWLTGRSGERGSGISVLAARHDDDDDDIYNIEHWTLSFELFPHIQLNFEIIGKRTGQMTNFSETQWPWLSKGKSIEFNFR